MFPSVELWERVGKLEISTAPSNMSQRAMEGNRLNTSNNSRVKKCNLQASLCPLLAVTHHPKLSFGSEFSKILSFCSLIRGKFERCCKFTVLCIPSCYKARHTHGAQCFDYKCGGQSFSGWEGLELSGVMSPFS